MLILIVIHIILSIQKVIKKINFITGFMLFVYWIDNYFNIDYYLSAKSLCLMIALYLLGGCFTYLNAKVFDLYAHNPLYSVRGNFLHIDDVIVIAAEEVIWREVMQSYLIDYLFFRFNINIFLVFSIVSIILSISFVFAHNIKYLNAKIELLVFSLALSIIKFIARDIMFPICFHIGRNNYINSLSHVEINYVLRSENSIYEDKNEKYGK